MKKVLFAVSIGLVLGFARPAAAQAVIPDTLAGKHVGETVTVEAIVHDVHDAKRRGIVYLNIGGAYPRITFTAHVPDSVAPRIPGLLELGGKKVRVTGRIWLQDEKYPAITVVEPAQLKLVE